MGRGIGDYRITRKIGRTRLAVVYAAEHAQLRRPVAIKVLAPEAGHAAYAFLHEARVLDRMRHPAIPRVYDCGTHEGAPWFATDLFAGHSLARVIAEGARIEVACVLRDLSAILLHAERHGVALRALTSDRVACVGDARGIALCITEWHDARAIADAPSDLAASVHALGVIAFQTLTGVMAHASTTLATLTGSASVADYAPRTSSRISWLIDRMLSRDPRDRPTLGEVHAQAARILEGARLPLPEVDATDEVTRIDIAIAG
jgi:serine/threonine protein kinase